MRGLIFVIVVVLVMSSASAKPFKVGMERNFFKATPQLLEHYNTIRRRGSGHQTPLDGNFSNLALFYAPILIGAKREQFHVQVDTGSSDLGIPQTGCKCGKHIDPYWTPKQDYGASRVSCRDPKLSQCSCTEASQCLYSIEYVDGSGYSAVIWNDTLAFQGAPTIETAYIGGITKEVGGSGFEPFQVDGILGLAQRFISSVDAPTPFERLRAENPSCANVFSMCGDVETLGGVLTLCGEGDHHTGQFAYTPMVDYEQGFYNIYGVDMTVNGTSVGCPRSAYNSGGGVTCDSGTTLMYPPSCALKGLEHIFLSMCDQVNLHGVCDVPKSGNLFANECFKFTSEQLAMFPDVVFVAGKENPINITLTPESYLLAGLCNDDDTYVLGFQDGGPTSFLFGDPLMISNEVVYDIGNKRMGFAPKSGCKV